MAVNDVTRESVLTAMQEFDGLGRDQFLERYGFGPAREYFVAEGGRLYDSKALVGVAHGFEPGRRPLTPAEFSGGERTVGAHLGRLGFRVTREGRDDAQLLTRSDPSWHLAVGQSIRRTELHDRYGGSRQDGVSPSRTTPNVLIFTDPASGERHGYFDRWREDGVFYYTGRGQRGDQVFESGNLAILNHSENGRALRVFEGAGGIVSYVGRFELADEQPWIYEKAPETDAGPDRQVIVFRLVPILEDDSGPDLTGAPRATGRDFRNRNEDVDPAPAVAASIDPDAAGRGLRAHRRLENELATAARSRGLKPRDPPLEGPAYDLAWVVNDILTVCEVKSLTTANQASQIRLGLGQVLDYAFTLRERSQPVRPVLVVERAPASTHWWELCREHGVILVWPDTLTELWEPSSDP